MSGPISAFARYSQREEEEEVATSPPQTDSVLPASRKRKRASMTNTNGHSKENSNNRNRSKSLLPATFNSQTNGQSHAVVEQSSTTRKPAKVMEKKFLSPAYPTPHLPRRVILSESRSSPLKKPPVVEEEDMEEENEVDDDEEEEDEEEEEDDDDDGSPLSAWLHDHVPIEDSVALGQHIFGLLINPIPVKQFIKRTWQREALLVQRKQPNYYNGLFSTGEIDDILRENTLEYGENIDLTFYNPATSKKERHNPEGLLTRGFDYLYILYWKFHLQVELVQQLSGIVITKDVQFEFSIHILIHQLFGNYYQVFKNSLVHSSEPIHI